MATTTTLIFVRNSGSWISPRSQNGSKRATECVNADAITLRTSVLLKNPCKACKGMHLTDFLDQYSWLNWMHKYLTVRQTPPLNHVKPLLRIGSDIFCLIYPVQPAHDPSLFALGWAISHSAPDSQYQIEGRWHCMLHHTSSFTLHSTSLALQYGVRDYQGVTWLRSWKYLLCAQLST